MNFCVNWIKVLAFSERFQEVDLVDSRTQVGNDVLNKSLFKPSRMHNPFLSELPSVAHCRRNSIVLVNSEGKSGFSTNS
jgi:hypothetical protein